MMGARTLAAALAALGIAVPAAAFNPGQTAHSARELSTPFTIAVLPDTQMYSDDPALTVHFEKQVEWVLAQREALNIVFVTHLGDVVDIGTDPGQWERAMGALRPLLEQHELPLSIVRGNHDDPATFLEHLPPDAKAARKWTVGASPSGLARAQIFKVESLRFLHLGLQVDPTPADLAWADALLASPDYAYLPVVVSTHDYLGLGARTAVGRGLWESFVSVHPMIFMVLNGHVHGEAARVSHDAAGRPVYQMLSDYQDRNFGGNGLLRLVTVDPVAGEMRVRTFSPWWRTTAPDGTAIYEPGYFETDWNSEFTFSLNVRERLAWDTTWDFGPEPPPPPPPALDPIHRAED
ncbi:MAG TPA: metallophosphoesterase, partial [Anaeromyxobacteraceae bacterium]|nr:metallophosphoesterase [Anaeromyxobacteraceae bacterium]